MKSTHVSKLQKIIKPIEVEVGNSSKRIAQVQEQHESNAKLG